MRYNDIKNDLFPPVPLFEKDWQGQYRVSMALWRVAHAIAGELDAISYNLRKIAEQGERKSKRPRK